jgi:hypothetical protein
MVPAARVRLNAIAAKTSHAPLDANWPWDLRQRHRPQLLKRQAQGLILGFSL